MSGVPSAASSGAAAPAGTDRNGSSSRRGEGSSSSPGRRPSATSSRTLNDVMREPSTTVPDVVVLDSIATGTARKEVLDPKEDLWLSTADGRYNSPIIPLHVGEAPYVQTFYVHKPILLKSEYFEKALCGDFKESDAQAIHLPEENPAIFHFLIAYLYEGKYEPIKSAASVLVPDQDKGKGHAGADTNADSESESGSDIDSDVSARSRRRRDRRRRREDRHWERMRQKHPGMHRPNCNCPQCVAASGPPCWSCRAPRNPPQPIHPHPNVVVVDPFGRPERQPRRPPRRRHGHPPPPPMTPPPPPPGWSADLNGGRISGEDLRTWLLAYELNIDVYILANKFLLEGFKKEIARVAIDMLETAGSDAAVPQVLFLCRKLYDGLPEADPLLKMIFARVGFLAPWRRSPDETKDFWLGNPDIAPLLLMETTARREDDMNGRTLPSMVRPWYAMGPGAADMGLGVGPYRGPPPPGVPYGGYGAYGPRTMTRNY